MINQKGSTLIELMIGITIGLIVLIAVGVTFGSILQSNSSEVREQRLEQTMQILTANMVSEIRRAGYTIAGITLHPPGGSSHNYYIQSNCILFSHYSPANGAEKFYGYKLNNNVVYYYESLAVTTSTSCSNLTNWIAVTELSQVKVNTLTFTLRAGSTALIDINLIAEAVGVTIQGGSPVQRNMTVSSRVRNG